MLRAISGVILRTILFAAIVLYLPLLYGDQMLEGRFQTDYITTFAQLMAIGVFGLPLLYAVFDYFYFEFTQKSIPAFVLAPVIMGGLWALILIYSALRMATGS